MKASITHARLRELLDYDPETGRFTWRVHRGGKAFAGDIAGRLQKSGHRYIMIDQEFYGAGRLAVFWMTGQ
jgi:hypothetical protein